MKPPRIPGKRVVFIGGRPVVLSDSDYRTFIAEAEKGFKGKKKGRGRK